MKRVLRVFLSLMIVAGIVLALWPVGQAAYGRWYQHRLQGEWEQASQAAHSIKRTNPQTTGLKKPAKTPARQASARQASTQRSRPSWPATRIVIPEIGVDAVVVQDWDESALRRGPGHDPYSALPGTPGNCVIAAHRNVYGAWFSRINELWAGSEIQLRTPDDTFTYRVLSVYAVADSDTSIRQSSPDPNTPPQLTLVTCTVPHTPSRIVVTAQMDEAMP